MKVIDLKYLDIFYNEINDISNDIAKLQYPQKYIVLKTSEGLKDLKLEGISGNKFILKIKE